MLRSKSESAGDVTDYPFPDYILEEYNKIKFKTFPDTNSFARHYEFCPAKLQWLPFVIPSRTLQFRKAILGHPQCGKDTCLGCMCAGISKLVNYKPNKEEEEKILKKQKALVAEIAAEISASAGNNYEAQPLQLVD